MATSLLNDSIRSLASRISKSVITYTSQNNANDDFETMVFEIIEESAFQYPWFTSEHIIVALELIAYDLELIASMEIPQVTVSEKKIGFIIRGKIPFEGYTEILFNAYNGIKCTVQLANEDILIFNRFVNLIKELPFATLITQSQSIKDVDGVILVSPSTGTLDEYLTKYPVLQLYESGRSFIITGDENEELQESLAASICMFFGRGRTNIKALFAPEGYDLAELESYLNKYNDQLFHNRYVNNYDYRKSVMIINRIKFHEAGSLLLTEDIEQTGNISVLSIVRYNQIDECYNHSIAKKYPIIHYEGSTDFKQILSGLKWNHNKISRFIARI